jgi:prepilin-type N-terminal cleavage/methylation domain-containing protein
MLLSVQRSKTGFTLIELLISVAILAIISSIGFVTYTQSQITARDSKRKQDLRSISVALELFYQRNGRYPCSGTTWTTSSASNWLTDSNTGTCGGSNLNLSPDYFSSMPKDPTGVDNNSPWSSGQRGYGYLSPNSAFNTCVQGSYYILVTQLENPKDPERLGNKPGQTIPFCGFYLSTAAAYSLDSFIITVP